MLVRRSEDTEEAHITIIHAVNLDRWKYHYVVLIKVTPVSVLQAGPFQIAEPRLRQSAQSGLMSFEWNIAGSHGIVRPVSLVVELS